jgi:formamidopyrimidine-DNA glycosylase
VPELPEVETIVRELAPRVRGRTLRNLRLYKTDVLRGVRAPRLLATLRRNPIRELTRRAKHFVFELTSAHRLVIQPRMTGSLLVYDRRLTPTERRYTVLAAGLGDGLRLVYRDVRRLGTVSLLDGRGWAIYTAGIGPEPLTDDFDAGRFARQMQGTRQAIKKALMDQRRLAGVGNIYANEALFRAGIDPSRGANRLTKAELARLYRGVRDVLREAVAAQGTTVRDYRTGTGHPGSYQHVLRVYGRGGEPCVHCGSRLVTTHAIDGRATTFCRRCQGAT